MSAHKNRQQGAGSPLDSQQRDPAALALVAAELRDVLRCHELMGILHYPRTGALSQFLGGQKSRPDRSRTGQGSQSGSAPRPQRERSAPAVPAETAAAISADIVACRRCEPGGLSPHRVAGQGGVQAKLMVVGDYCSQEAGRIRKAVFGPREDEMLWKMMQAIDLSPDEVYVTNLLKCLPPGDGRTDPGMAARCLSYLVREIGLVRPKMICAMGDMAAHQLLGRTDPLVRLRGVFHDYRYGEGSQLPVMVTFHPRFLLANAEMKKAAWLDLQQIQRRLVSR